MPNFLSKRSSIDYWLSVWQLECSLSHLFSVYPPKHLPLPNVSLPPILFYHSFPQTPLPSIPVNFSLPPICPCIPSSLSSHLSPLSPPLSPPPFLLHRPPTLLFPLFLSSSRFLPFFLAQTDADMNCCDSSGHTPLHVAAGQGKSPIVSLLIAAGQLTGTPHCISTAFSDCFFLYPLLQVPTLMTAMQREKPLCRLLSMGSTRRWPKCSEMPCCRLSPLPQALPQAMVRECVHLYVVVGFFLLCVILYPTIYTNM